MAASSTYGEVTLLRVTSYLPLFVLRIELIYEAEVKY
jgi:hypothetical protein